MKNLILFIVVIFCFNISLAQSIVKVDDYLSKGSDTKAIRDALNAARKFSGQKVLLFSNRIYFIDPSEIISDVEKNMFLYPIFSDLIIRGSSKTELRFEKSWAQKSKINLNNFVLFGSKQYISKLSLETFKVDFNGVILQNRNATVSNAVLFLTQGKDISMESISVLNNPGRQSVYLGTTSSDGRYLVSNVKINNCTFINNADNVKGSTQNDHSTIYVAANNAVIRNNVLNSGNGLSRVATAIEAHTINSDVSYNSIKNYSTGINIVATTGNQIGTTYSYNTFQNVRKAFVFWGLKDKKIDNIKIVNNKIYQAEVNDPIIRMEGTLKTYIGNLEITGNTFSTSFGQRKSIAIGHGIEISYVKDIYIIGNHFKNLNGRAVTMGGTNFNIDNLVIEKNTFENINAANNTKYKYMVELKAIGKINKLLIQNNIIDRKDYFFDAGNSVKILSPKVIKNNLNPLK